MMSSASDGDRQLDGWTGVFRLLKTYKILVRGREKSLALPSAQL